MSAPAPAVTTDWTFVGNPGNACDPQIGQGCFGSVAYGYRIGTYEVTNAQYTEFLNAKAAADPLALYSDFMGSDGQITRSGIPGSYTYSVTSGLEDVPVVHVAYWDALRFANWLNNGQGNGDTETGSYTLLGGTPTPSNAATVTRNPAANIVLASEDEWYKAAYYDPSAARYFDYPIGTNLPPVCSAPTAAPNSANCGFIMSNAAYWLTPVGSYSSSASPYGTFDQGGNAREWLDEVIVGDSRRLLRGGDFFTDPSGLSAGRRTGATPNTDPIEFGFRLAEVPEPGTGMLVAIGMGGLAVRRRARA